MMKIAPFLILVLLNSFLARTQNLLTVFEKSKGTKTPEYKEIINFYKQLDKLSPRVFMKEYGMSDAGFPLHLVLFSNDGRFDPAAWHKQNKAVLLINNGIHPGEPDGIDASLLLVRDLVTGKKHIPDNVTLAFIPVYNIGGCLNRSANYRIDQNGPVEFGFRGNSQNLDLNRDFIKCDSREARSFAAIFHDIDPDIFIDNHVSNGADYQHIMTLLTSQHSKLGGMMGEYLHTQLEPGLYALMKSKGYDLVPYVNFFGEKPEDGWSQFFDSPRYSSGFATLWNTFGFTPETHMLKPFENRVRSTYALMESCIEYAGKHAGNIKSIRRQAKENVSVQTQFPVRWELDSSRTSQIMFKGFESGKMTSLVFGLPRLHYDRNKPFEKSVTFYNHYKPSVSITKPLGYIIPQGWWKVIDLLKINRVNMRRLTQDSLVDVELYYTEDYTSSPKPFEMHHLNSVVKLRVVRQSYRYRKGDVYIPMNQAANRFIVEVLEPQSNDSYFAWNFFDSILGQKEGFSSYVFEDRAAALLKAHPEIKSRLENKKAEDSVFSKSASAQLDFVFRNSPYMEPDFLRYPVGRVMK
ncbi:MAG: M14 family metallopeptidase [Chitinophagaceae bacterium]